MVEPKDTLCYHGSRSVDELVGALKAGNGAAAQAHRELSRLHLDKFVETMTSLADASQNNQPQPFRAGNYDQER